MADILIIHESALLPQILAARGKELKAFLGSVHKMKFDNTAGTIQCGRAEALEDVMKQASEQGANTIIVTVDAQVNSPRKYGWQISGNAVLLEDIREGKS